MRKIEDHDVYIGDLGDLKDFPENPKDDIKYILNVSKRPVKKMKRIIPERTYVHVPVVDGDQPEPWNSYAGPIDMAIQNVQKFLFWKESEEKILVACAAGISRSPAVAAAAIANEKGTDFDKALEKTTLSQNGPAPHPEILEHCRRHYSS